MVVSHFHEFYKCYGATNASSRHRPSPHHARPHPHRSRPIYSPSPLLYVVGVTEELSGLLDNEEAALQSVAAEVRNSKAELDSLLKEQVGGWVGPVGGVGGSCGWVGPVGGVNGPCRWGTVHTCMAICTALIDHHLPRRSLALPMLLTHHRPKLPPVPPFNPSTE